MFFDVTTVHLRSDEVRIARSTGMPWRRSAAHARAFPVSNGAGGGEPWRGAVERLAEGLAEARIAGGALQAVVSDHFARYVLLPWSANVVADSERIAYGRLQFEEIYGDVVDTWDIAVDQQPAGQASFACAIDRELMRALTEVCARQRMRLHAVVPTLVDRLNRHRRSLRGTSFCLASLEPGRLTLAFRRPAGWHSVRSRRVEEQALRALPGALRQESAAGGALGAGRLYVIGDEGDASAPLNLPGWTITRLGDRSSPAGAARRANREAVRA